MIGKKFLIPALALAAATCFAGPGDSNWSLRFGVVFPNTTNTGLSSDAGFSYSVAYRLYRGEGFSLHAEAQGSVYSVNDGAGDDATITVGGLNLLGIAHMKSSPVYVGGTVGFTQATASSDGFTTTGETKGVWGVLAGVPLSRQWFVEGRYMWSDVPASRGTVVYAGYRF